MRTVIKGQGNGGIMQGIALPLPLGISRVQAKSGNDVATVAPVNLRLRAPRPGIRGVCPRPTGSFTRYGGFPK